ncbi:MAG: hypothetical protein KDD10_24165 [Phaeodactylibacter sp.]|nr:hypothetical protein [Phaeodactylibacter sp.]MCB9295072.1 hypothetical protein [Lewinellaceae bacterium]
MSIDWPTIIDGLLISGVGYLVVLLALSLLYFVFRYLPDILHARIRSRLRRQGKDIREDESVVLVGNESAAIATALYLYFNEVHDEEDTIMTIKKISKRYSPWSSKIFGVMKNLKP